MRDNAIYCYFLQQLRVPTGNREFPARKWEGGRRTARAAPSTSPDVTTPGFSHLVGAHFPILTLYFPAFPGSEDGFPSFPRPMQQ